MDVSQRNRILDLELVCPVLEVGGISVFLLVLVSSGHLEILLTYTSSDRLGKMIYLLPEPVPFPDSCQSIPEICKGPRIVLAGGLGTGHRGTGSPVHPDHFGWIHS